MIKPVYDQPLRGGQKREVRAVRKNSRPIRRLLAAALAGCLLAGCAGRELALLPQSLPPQSTPAPTETPAPQPLCIACEAPLPAGFEALLEAYAASQAAGAVLLDPGDAGGSPDLVLLARRPGVQGYLDLAQDPLFTVLIQNAAALPGQDLSGPCPALPLGFGGYGYLADGELLKALLGEGFDPALLQQASSAEWTGFVQALGGWIEQPAAQPVTLAGQEFTLPAEPPPAAQALTGVFAVPAAEPDAFAGSALSPVLCTAFQTAGEAKADEELLTGPLNSLWSAFRLETGWMAGPEGPLARGNEQAAGQTLADAAGLVAGGRAVFCRAFTGRLLPLLPAEQAARMLLAPLKYPFDETDLAPNAAYTLEQLAGWPVVGTAGWLAIPQDAGEDARARAEGFLLWLFASAEGQRALTEGMGLLGIAGGEPSSPALQTAAGALAAGEALPDLAEGFAPAAHLQASEALAKDWLPQASWNPYQRAGYTDAVLAALGGAG